MSGARLAAALLGGALLLPASGTAQQGPQIVFESDLPRVMVFLQEEGATAASVVTGFLRDAGFEVVDPAFAKTAAERERAQRALAGDDVAATELGRDLGAQVIILGRAPVDAAPNPVDAALQVGTAQLNVRALRLDEPRLVASGATSGRAVDATPGGAQAAALRKAVEALLYETSFLGNVANDWGERRWDDVAYWQPERSESAGGPAAPTASAPGTAAPVASGRPGLTLAVIESEAIADTTGGSGTRGIEVSARPTASSLSARIRGIVSDPGATVWVGGRPAAVRGLSTDERSRYQLDGSSALFEATVPVLASQDTVRVRAEAPSGTAELLVRPVVGRRWAVVIGVSEYADERIRALRYADDDAQAMYEFLRSPAGGAIPEGQIRLLLNRDATADAIRDALFVFLQQADPADHVTVYVASHGAPDPNRPANLYILPYDTDLGAIASSAFPMWDFKTALRRQISSERVVVIADACHSAGTLVQDSNPIGGAFADLFTPSRRVTLSAADTNESSLEGPQWGDGHGVFTYTLLEGLSGPADQNGDGVVSFTEAADYVQSRVATATSGRQNPQRAGLGDLPLAQLGPEQAPQGGRP